MNKEKIRKTLISIENWCKDNEISIFYGSINNNTFTKVEWTKTTENAWKEYLLTLIKTSSKLIIIDIIPNDIDKHKREIRTYKEAIENEELQVFENALSVLNNTIGEIANLKLNYFHDNVCYGYTQIAEWNDQYLTVQVAFQNKNEEIVNKTQYILSKLKEFNDDTVSPTLEKLSEERIEELARKITSLENYITEKNPVQRTEIANSVLKHELFSEYSNIWMVRNRADNIYETEIRPMLEEKIRKKVLELKLKGLKKVEISSKLNISPGMVNRFYYTDK